VEEMPFVGRRGSTRCKAENWIIFTLSIVVLAFFLFVVYISSSPAQKFSLSPEEEKDVIVLTDANFHTKIAKGYWAVDFYNPFCSFCAEFAPIWASTATLLKETLPLAKVDILDEKDLATLYKITKYPTIKLFKDGQEIAEFKDQRTQEKILEFLRSNVPSLKQDETHL